MPIRTMLLATALENTPLQAISVGTRQSFVFTAYGHCHASSGPPSLGYNGERFETLTGHYLLGNGYRAYNPLLMRFNSPDSLSPFGRGGINAYVYCGADPVNRVDPSGHISGPGFRLPRFLNGPQRVVRMGSPKIKNHALDLYDGTADYLMSRSYPDIGNVRMYSDAMLFQDKGGTRTTLVASGKPGLAQFEGKLRSGSLLVDDMRAAGGITAQTAKFRLVVCCSADLGMRSLTSTFARHSGLPTKGYRGYVFNNFRTLQEFAKNEPPQGVLDDFVRTHYVVVKQIRSTLPRPSGVANIEDWDSEWRHGSVTFRP